jgi:putative resolvase
MRMKLSTWARENGLSYRTAWRMFHAGTLPVEAEQLATGTIIVKTRAAGEKAQGVALYARVSSADQKNDLDRQVARLLEYAVKKRLPIAKSVTEIGSAMMPVGEPSTATNIGVLGGMNCLMLIARYGARHPLQ